MSNPENNSDAIALNLVYATAASVDMKTHYNNISVVIEILTKYGRDGDIQLMLSVSDALRDVQRGIAQCMAEITKNLDNIADLVIYSEHNKVNFEYTISTAMKILIDEVIEHRKNMNIEKIFSVSERMITLFVKETGRSEDDAQAWLCNYFRKETNPALN